VSDLLILEYEGWILLRLPTDPDPPDEKRGISGYTFAFGNEPDLDRVLHLQPPQTFKPRSHAPQIGVFVQNATRIKEGIKTPIPALQNASVNLLDNPTIENRNWVLTLPGEEPIVPFNMQIIGENIMLRRKAPLDYKNPDTPFWQVSQELINAQGAHGLEFEPGTIGRATGIWDTLAVAKERRAVLAVDLEALEKKHGDPIEITILKARIAQLDIALNANPPNSDRRTAARYFVERFGFPMQGETEIQGDQQATLGGLLATAPVPGWQVYFWIGAWDPDVMCAFMQGSLEIPYQA
jgi:hypothetical protein